MSSLSRAYDCKSFAKIGHGARFDATASFLRTSLVASCHTNLHCLPVTGDERFLTALQGRVMKSHVGVAVLLLTGSLSAQFDGGTGLQRLRVRVAFSNGLCDRSTHVRLSGRNGPVAEGDANDRCEVDLGNIPVGTYHLNVSGQNFPETDEVVSLSRASTELEVNVKRADDSDAAVSAGAVVSAADLAIPHNAQKEFEKSNDQIARQDFNRAMQSLNRAIAIYPAYASAYNNLGVVYARLGDRERERDALKKALSINDHFAPAYVNLGRMNIATGDFSNAELALTKAASYDPKDAMTLVLLAYSELMDKHFDQVITASRKAHTLQGTHAFAHQLAARAFEQKRDAADAITELKQFLKEEPEGERADLARKELAAVRRIPH
jgi:tetratricopeptide (TPR) repeat protein